MKLHLLCGLAALVLLSGCSKPDPNGDWTFSSDLTRAEDAFPKGAEGDKAIAIMAAFLPRLKIENNSWTAMRDSIRCTIQTLDTDRGVTCVSVKDQKPTGFMRIELKGDLLKIKDGQKPTYVYKREK